MSDIRCNMLLLTQKMSSTYPANATKLQINLTSQLLNYFSVRKKKLLGGQRPPQDLLASQNLAHVPWCCLWPHNRTWVAFGRLKVIFFNRKRTRSVTQAAKKLTKKIICISQLFSLFVLHQNTLLGLQKIFMHINGYGLNYKQTDLIFFFIVHTSM